MTYRHWVVARETGVSANLRRMLAGATLCVLALSAASADDIKAPLRGLVSMGAYRFVGSGGDPVNTLERLTPSRESSAGWS
jgi:hypothetical protein